MEKFGGWPTLGSNRGGNWKEAEFNLEELMILISNDTTSLPLALISIYQDLKHPIEYIVTVGNSLAYRDD